jgi:hypothetical protein
MTEKVLKTKYINIDARFSNEFLCFPFSDYIVELPETIHNIRTISIQCIEIPISFYNICDDLENNNFNISNVDIPSKPVKTKIVIPDNHYTHETLIEEINEQLQQNNINGVEFATKKNNIVLSSSGGNHLIDFNKNKEKTNKNNFGNVLGLNKNSYLIEPYSEIRIKNICNYLNPRYLFLEIRELDGIKCNRNTNTFTSSTLCSRISKYIIARITMEYNSFPYGSILTANISNGLLISDTRRYYEKIRIEDLEIRLLNEFGYPVCLNGHEISFCMVVEYEEDIL